MNVEDLIRLLNNRLREFKLSRDYATMSGDLERVVAADKEIIALEDTLFKLNLLVDASQSAAVKESTLAETITDGSVAVLGEYDITPYATDPQHEEKIMNILSKMGLMEDAEQIDDYIKGKYASSPITGEMIMNAAKAYTVDARLMMAIMELDSRFGTVGIAVDTINPGNVGNDDSGNTRTYGSWQDGVTAVAEWLNRHRGSTTVPEIPGTSAEPTLPVATSTLPTIAPTAATTTTVTTTVTTATTTPTTIPLTGSGQATSTSTTATTTDPGPTSQEPTPQPSEDPEPEPDTATNSEDGEEETPSGVGSEQTTISETATTTAN